MPSIVQILQFTIVTVDILHSVYTRYSGSSDLDRAIFVRSVCLSVSCLSLCVCVRVFFCMTICLPVLVFLKHYACLYVLTMQAPTVFIFGWHFPFIKLLHMTSKSTIPITSNLTPIDPGRVEYSTNIHVSCSNRSGPEFLDAPSFGQGSLSPIWISDRPVALERVQGRHGT